MYVILYCLIIVYNVFFMEVKNMGYTTIKNFSEKNNFDEKSLEGAAIKFIRESCEELRFDSEKSNEKISKNYTGTSLEKNQIPYNMQMDIDRLCLENAISRFLKSGKKEDAFDVYFCYLEMFIGDYEKTRRMIELLSEFEANGSELLMKHRDHYSHSAYVFVLGLAIYETNSIFRKKYNSYYGLEDDHNAACHYLQYWGLTSLFHDIGYPFELPFEQVTSYFEVNNKKRDNNLYISYNALESITKIDENTAKKLKELYGEHTFDTTNNLFAYILFQKLGNTYSFTEEQMNTWLNEKPTCPDKFGFYMDHAYFSATILFKKLFCEMGCDIKKEHIDALTAILIHNSMYKFCIAHYKEKGNIPFKAQLHPLAFVLMLCDELQCWDRTAYGRNTKTELYPMQCDFDFSDNLIKTTYIFDLKEIGKINRFKDDYIKWLKTGVGKEPKLKAYSEMYLKDNGVSNFLVDIERIVDLSEIKLSVDIGISNAVHAHSHSYLSSSNFLNLYRFAYILNGRWNSGDWRKLKDAGKEEVFISNEESIKNFEESFKNLSLEYKMSNINQAKAFARYMDEIGCFYTDKQVDFEMVEHFTDEELLKIGMLEHQRWLQEHYDMGWEYGTPAKSERELVRQHKDMIPDFDSKDGKVSLKQAQENYARLGKSEQDKDTEPMECMLAMLKMFDGLRIYRLK